MDFRTSYGLHFLRSRRPKGGETGRRACEARGDRTREDRSRLPSPSRALDFPGATLLVLAQTIQQQSKSKSFWKITLLFFLFLGIRASFTIILRQSWLVRAHVSSSRGKVSRHVTRHGNMLFIIDHVQLFESTGLILRFNLYR